VWETKLKSFATSELRAELGTRLTPVTTAAATLTTDMTSITTVKSEQQTFSHA
jgi:hypothetical protein